MRVIQASVAVMETSSFVGVARHRMVTDEINNSRVVSKPETATGDVAKSAFLDRRESIAPWKICNSQLICVPAVYQVKRVLGP